MFGVHAQVSFVPPDQGTPRRLCRGYRNIWQKQSWGLQVYFSLNVKSRKGQQLRGILRFMGNWYFQNVYFPKNRTVYLLIIYGSGGTFRGSLVALRVVSRMPADSSPKNTCPQIRLVFETSTNVANIKKTSNNIKKSPSPPIAPPPPFRSCVTISIARHATESFCHVAAEPHSSVYS